MADFSVDLKSQSSTPSPIQPVESVNYAPIFNFVEGMGKLFAESAKDKKKEEAEAAKMAVLQEFSRRSASIGDAVTTGQVTASAGSTHSRVLFDQFFGQYPQYHKELREIVSGFKEHGGVSEAFDEEKAAKDNHRNAIKAAQTDGIVVSLSDSTEYQKFAIQAHQSQIALRKETEERRKARAEIRAESAEERASLDFRDKRESFESITRTAEANAPLLQIKAQDLIAKVQAGMNPQQARTEWQTLYGQWQGTLATASKYNPESIGYWKEFSNNMNKYFEEGITGKVVSEATQNAFNSSMNLAKSGILKDPETARMFAAFNLAPNLTDSLIRLGNEGVIKKVLQSVVNSAPLGSTSDPKTASAAKDIYNKGVEALNTNKVSDEKVEGAKRELDNTINSVMKDLSASSIYGMSNDSLKPIVTILTNPYLAKQIQEGRVSRTAGENAQEVIKRFYSSPVIQQVGIKMQEPFSVSKGFLQGEKQFKMSDVVDVSFVGEQVLFSPKETFNVNPYGQVNESIQQDRRRIIDTLTPSATALTQMIKMEAHLEGHTDYKKQWEDNKHVYFPNIYPDPNKLKEGQIVKAKNGKSYKYIGGDYNDITNSYVEVASAGE